MQFTYTNMKRFLIGRPFPTRDEIHERLDKVRGLAIFASDPISSNAYATEAIMSGLASALENDVRPIDELGIPDSRALCGCQDDAVRAGLQFVLADVMRPPYQPGTFDLVITPWLLDVIEGGAAPVLARINHLLTDGGTWINHGSVAFQSPDPALRLTLEELGCLAAEMGFQTTSGREASLPYMNCPDSRHGRIETVSTSRALKVETLEKPEKHRALPDWIVTGKCPVPALPSFQTQAMTTRIHAFIMSLIDGQRSLKDMAWEMEAQQLMTRQEGEEALRGFLTKMYDEAGRSSAL